MAKAQKDPAPMGNAAKKDRDRVLSAIKIGNKFVSLLAGVLATVLILYSGYVLYDGLATEYGAYTSSWDLLKYKPDAAMAQLSGGTMSMADVNQDYRAWLTINDTTIDYPVVQGPNDLYYASHDAYGNSSLTGAIYLSVASSPVFTDSYSVIYGHHMNNGAMFGSLDRFRDGDYFRSHQNGTLVTVGGETFKLKIFAVATTDAYESRIYTAGNRGAEVKAFLTGDRSKDTGIGTTVLQYDGAAAGKGSKVVALSTCADAETNGRLVVFAVIEEEKETPNVTLTVYYKLEDGTEVRPKDVFIYEAGGHYYVVVPQIPGYEPSLQVLRGTITDNMQYTIVYRLREYSLRIRYRFMDGTEASETYRTVMHAGEIYNIASPKIPGYIAIRLRVEGSNPGRDEQYTVLYIPEDEMIIPEENTPLYSGVTQMQTGICSE